MGSAGEAGQQERPCRLGSRAPVWASRAGEQGAGQSRPWALDNSSSCFPPSPPHHELVGKNNAYFPTHCSHLTFCMTQSLGMKATPSCTSRHGWRLPRSTISPAAAGGCGAGRGRGLVSRRKAVSRRVAPSPSRAQCFCTAGLHHKHHRCMHTQVVYGCCVCAPPQAGCTRAHPRWAA